MIIDLSLGALAMTGQSLPSPYSCTLSDLLTNVNCTGEEFDIGECQSDRGTCSYSQVAGVVCQRKLDICKAFSV